MKTTSKFVEQVVLPLNDVYQCGHLPQFVYSSGESLLCDHCEESFGVDRSDPFSADVIFRRENLLPFLLKKMIYWSMATAYFESSSRRNSPCNIFFC